MGTDLGIMNTFILLACLIGAAAAVPSLHIVGGRDVSPPGKWPHQAALISKSSGSHNCGAVLISKRWLVTAAHCIGGSAYSNQIVLGQHDRVSKRQGAPVKYDIQSMIKHPNFRNDGRAGFPNDVAVILLTRDATYNSYVQPIAMASPSNGDFVGADCYITGWGRLYGFGPLPNILQEAKMNPLTLSECRNMWGNQISNFHICLLDQTNRQSGGCQGDSGGPLVCRANSRSSYVLAGVTSWGSGQCTPRQPSVYTRISYF